MKNIIILVYYYIKMKLTVLIGDQEDDDPVSIDANLTFMPTEKTTTHILNMNNYKEIIDNIDKDDIIINLCDGCDEEDNIPGLCVLRMLEEQKRTFTGCSSGNYIWKKGDIKKYNVSTPKYAIVGKQNYGEVLSDIKLNYPLIIKPNSNDGGSSGILKDSVVNNLRELEITLIKRFDTFKEYNEYLLEEYIDGREVTVLAVQNINNSEPIVFEPLECIFNGQDKFKHYELKWLDNTVSSVYYQQIDDEQLNKKIMEFGKKIFEELKLDGYVRFDIRIDKDQNLYVIDVNPYCSIFYSPQNYGCADSILKYSKIMNHTDFLMHIIECAKRRYD